MMTKTEQNMLDMARNSAKTLFKRIFRGLKNQKEFNRKRI